ncbi:bifunctional diaminohydroxyphosphoribosylaminopyrimidine deaminase/5-amino-6-(5-phosphoribosylamino)uracil reductase RibD [bacterium]|nr:bifunctional diaminohydroxyphosphoribosylaminopyrimidine deaminase/5-amino-6-(5-phosphoribosylamino)uracil reductase RibD [bacterium]
MNDKKYMRVALKLAVRAKGRTSPNPLVGAVIVKDNRIIGKGYHRRAGEPHAEINALDMAGERARGATLYLNLEPCAHFGRTSPCTKKIISSRIKEVVVAMIDPNPLNCGRGVKELRKAGIEVKVRTLKKEAKKINEAYIKYITTKKPFVILKTAMSLDGKIATKTGDSKWITNESSRKYVHKLRSEVDAVLVGIETVLKDDPLLTIRCPKSKVQSQPVRVVVDSRARIPLGAKILNRAAPTIVATTKLASRKKIEALKKKGAKVLIIKNKNRKVDLRELLKRLGELEITSLLVEGGGRINASFLKNGLVDKVLFFIAPKIIGGEEALTPVEGEGIERIKHAIKLKDISIKRFREDVLIEGYIKDDVQ